MKTSLMSPIKKTLVITAILALSCLIYGFKAGIDELQWLNWSNKCLSESYAPVVDAKLKKWEINLTNDHFLRLRKTYQHGRQEYFSFNLHRLNDIEYMGNDTTGTLEFTTLADDIIVQTYEDPKGDIDSMSTVLELPVKNMSQPRLDSLKSALKYFKEKEL
ncbi:hypothetical protein SAMN05216464_114121 [Mucilaginibacter pineti]|uniref:Uncharacterized protein n=1 Tax=Mucilaginibacter pineti TaxID=1391627 RepID=A0A1G7JAR7_9SPHI|nr:hypothetical protein [Mucilaginibacter pineti]SDF22040.1 hypothetical protein SAMN05216464_114121 [Mucilaginibacter pineti]